MAELKKSELLDNVLETIIRISGRKTSKGHAIFTMEELLKNLTGKYEFLKHVQINDTRFTEDDNAVSVMSAIDNTKPKDLGKAIYEIIVNVNSSLGRDAGHFFMKEIKNTLDDDQLTTMMNMGVDLSLMQLEHEVEEWERILTRKKQE